MQKLLTMRSGRRFALLGALTALAMGLIVSSALASVKLSPEGTYSSAEGGQATTAVTVSGTAPAGATNVAIAVCDVSVPAEIGKRCDKAASTGEALKTVGQYKKGIQIDVRKGPWQAFDFTMGTPPTEVEVGGEKVKVTCKGTGSGTSQCGVVVSYYKVEGATFEQVGAEAADILFE